MCYTYSTMNEKGVKYDTVEEKVWQKRMDFLRINPACKVPVLKINDNYLNSLTLQ